MKPLLNLLAPVLAIAFAALLGISIIDGLTTKGNLEEFKGAYEQVQKQAENALKVNAVLQSELKVRQAKEDSLQAKADSSAKKVVALTVTANTLRGKVSELKEEAKTIEEKNSVIAMQDTLIGVLDSTVSVQQEEIVALTSKVVLLEDDKQSLQTINQNLETVIRNLPKNPPKKGGKILGVLPMPSRAAVAVVSAVGGVVVWEKMKGK